MVTLDGTADLGAAADWEGIHMPARRPALAVLLAGALALALSACDGQDEPEETTPTTTPVFEQEAPTTEPQPDDAADRTDGARTDGDRTAEPPPGGVSPVDDAVDPVQTGGGDDDPDDDPDDS